MRFFLLGINLFLVVISSLMVLTVGAVEPAERNIIYIHAPAAICSLVCFCVLFAGSVQYLRTKNQKWSFIAAASGEVGFVFATVLNITGMIFAYIEWGMLWTPSPRLVSSAALWFLLAAYLILRVSFTNQRRKEQISAVFGIVAFIDVPLVVISARLVRDIHRPSLSFDTVGQILAFLLVIFATGFLAALLIWIRSDILKIKNEMDMRF
jgi:heme exporter protein C